MSASRFNKGFSTVLYTMFIIEHGYDVKSVAAEIGVAPATLYEYIRDETTFPPDLIAPLYNATRDRRVLSIIMNAAHQVFLDAPSIDCESSREVVQECIASQQKHLEVIKKALDSVNDGEVTLRELEEMEPQVYESMAATVKLFESLRRHRKGKRA